MNAICPRCAWPVRDATVLSRHLIADGAVTYRRCVCGAVLVDAPAVAPSPTAAPAVVVAAGTAAPPGATSSVHATSSSRAAR